MLSHGAARVMAHSRPREHATSYSSSGSANLGFLFQRTGRLHMLVRHPAIAKLLKRANAFSAVANLRCDCARLRKMIYKCLHQCVLLV